MSKILMPSHAVFSVAGSGTDWQESSLRELSVDRNSRFPAIETSFWDPGQCTTVTTSGRQWLMS